MDDFRDFVPSVASYTGAWIETRIASELNSMDFVASYTGAWIETASSVATIQTPESHPIRVRGLKL